MRRILAYGIVLAGLLAAGQHAAAQPRDRLEAACPPAGLDVEMWAGGVTRHGGPLSAEEWHVCRIRTGGTPTQMLFQVFFRDRAQDRAMNPDLAARERDIVAGLRPLWPLQVGKAVEFTYAERSATGVTIHRRETWRVTERGEVAIEGGRAAPCDGAAKPGDPLRCVFRVERRRIALFDLNEEIAWDYAFDAETSAILTMTVRAERGTIPGMEVPYRAIELERR